MINLDEILKKNENMHTNARTPKVGSVNTLRKALIHLKPNNNHLIVVITCSTFILSVRHMHAPVLCCELFKSHKHVWYLFVLAQPHSPTIILNPILHTDNTKASSVHTNGTGTHTYTFASTNINAYLHVLIQQVDGMCTRIYLWPISYIVKVRKGLFISHTLLDSGLGLRPAHSISLATLPKCCDAKKYG